MDSNEQLTPRTLGGGNSWAVGMTTPGKVVGSSDTAAGPAHASITRADGAAVTDLATPGEVPVPAFGIDDTTS